MMANRWIPFFIFNVAARVFTGLFVFCWDGLDVKDGSDALISNVIAACL